MKNTKKNLDLANALQDLWDVHEENTGEQAAYHIACEQLGIDPNYGYELLALLD